MTTYLATNNLSQENVKLIGNRYIIEKTLGSGNCGTAFLTLDGKTKNFEKKVIKRICIGNLALGDTVTAANEGKLLKGLQHNNIITYFDSFLDGEFYCLVTEFCDEGDLDSKIQENKSKGVWLEEEQIISWIVQLLMALEYIHSRNILHRDLKTKNIFLKQGSVKIGDFGISRILATPTELADTFIGTPYYMSPEVLNHQGYNTKSDVWSVGCVLYDLASYEHPFKGTSLVAIISNIIHSAHPPWPHRYSSQLGDIFRLCETNDFNDYYCCIC